jgi:hypothetical protein
MKSLITMLLILSLGFAAQAQTVKVDAQGNYIAVKDTATKANKPDSGKDTGKTYTDSKGKKWPVMESANGKLYVLRTSAKTGNQYRQYLKVQQ